MRRDTRVTLAAVTALWTLAVATAQLQVAQAPQPSTAGQQPTFRSGVELITIDATVVDGTGQPVAGIGADDFAVTVDGQRRRVVSAQFVDLSGSTPRPHPAGAARPRSTFSSNEIDAANRVAPPDRFILLAVDHSSFMPGAGRSTLEAARRFLASLDPSDRISLAAYPDPGLFVPPTTDHAAIARALGRIAGTADRIEPSHMELTVGLSEAIEIAAGERSTLERVVTRECFQAGAVTDIDQCRTMIELDSPPMVAQLRAQTARSLQGLQGLLENLEAISGRKTLILVSAGLTASAERSSMDIMSELRAASAAAARANTVIHALHVDTALMDAVSAERRRVSTTAVRDAELMAAGLETLVDLNGGALFRVPAAADLAFGRVAREISAYYVLGIEAGTTDRDGRPHEIKVRVPGRGSTVRHRQQFTIARPSAADASPDEMLATILRSGQVLRDLPVRVATQVMRDLKGNNVRVLVRADIGQDVATPAHLRVGFALYDAAGQPTGAATRFGQFEPTSIPGATWPFQEVVTLRPGTYTLRLAARDADGRVGTVAHQFDATLQTGEGARLSDLLVADSERAGRSQPAPLVDGRVRGSRLNTFVEIYPDRGASVSSVSFAVTRNGSGAALATAQGEMTAWPQDQRAAARANLDVHQLPPGEYLVTATAYDRATVLGSVSRSITVERAATTGSLPAPASDGPVPASETPADSGTAARFRPGDVLRADALAYFLGRLREADAAGHTPPVAAAAAAAARGEFDVVLRELDGADSASLPVAFLKGLALFANGDVEASAGQFRSALRTAPAFMPAAFYLGACYAASARDEQAVAAWQTTLLAERGAPIVYEALADAWLRLQDGGQAAAVLTAALERWPGDERFVRRMAAARALQK